LWGDPSKALDKLNWSPKYDFKSLALEMYEIDLKREMGLVDAHLSNNSVDDK
jgi:GDP-D-mannose dehydratase